MSEEEKVEQTSLEKIIFILVGAALLFGGVSIINDLLANIKHGIVYLFILFLPAPMVVFGIFAMYEGLFNNKPTKPNNTSKKNLSIAIEVEKTDNDSSNQKTDSLETKAFLPQGNDDVGSHLATLFFIFGFVILLIIFVVITIMDVNSGVTNVCPRRSSCYKVYLSDSPMQFYINLILGRAYYLIATAVLGIFTYKRLKE